MEVDQKPVTNAAEATRAMESPRSGGHLLRVKGPRGARFLTLPEK